MPHWRRVQWWHTVLMFIGSAPLDSPCIGQVNLQ